MSASSLIDVSSTLIASHSSVSEESASHSLHVQALLTLELRSPPTSRHRQITLSEVRRLVFDIAKLLPNIQHGYGGIKHRLLMFYQVLADGVQSIIESEVVRERIRVSLKPAAGSRLPTPDILCDMRYRTQIFRLLIIDDARRGFSQHRLNGGQNHPHRPAGSLGKSWASSSRLTEPASGVASGVCSDRQIAEIRVTVGSVVRLRGPFDLTAWSAGDRENTARTISEPR